MAAARPPLETLPIAAARRRVLAEALAGAGPRVEMAAVEDLTVPGGDAGASPLPARLYVPRAETRAGALLVYFHGGGFAVGGLETHEDACRLLADAAGVRVLAATYRLAPEHRFPAAAEDALAAWRWATDEGAERLGADPSRVAVAGDSAGANLAALAAADAHRSGVAPMLQLLVYPWLDLAAAADAGSRARLGVGHGLSNSELAWYAGLYLGDSAPEAARDPRASPLRRRSLAGLPPAWIAAAGRDPLRDDAEAYARCLRGAGVEATLRIDEELEHGYVEALGAIPAGREALLAGAAALRGTLAA